MKLKNKYQKFSKITEPKCRQILQLFAFNLTASDTAKLTGISVRSINSLRPLRNTGYPFRMVT